MAAVLGVLLGITMCALVCVCLYAWQYRKENEGRWNGYAVFLSETNERMGILAKRRELAPEPEEPKNPRFRTLSEAIRAAEDQSSNPLRRNRR